MSQPPNAVCVIPVVKTILVNLVWEHKWERVQ